MVKQDVWLCNPITLLMILERCDCTNNIISLHPALEGHTIEFAVFCVCLVQIQFGSGNPLSSSYTNSNMFVCLFKLFLF